MAYNRSTVNFFSVKMDWVKIGVILSVAVVEFGRHTPHYWSETYHGVSMEC